MIFSTSGNRRCPVYAKHSLPGLSLEAASSARRWYTPDIVEWGIGQEQVYRIVIETIPEESQITDDDPLVSTGFCGLTANSLADFTTGLIDHGAGQFLEASAVDLLTLGPIQDLGPFWRLQAGEPAGDRDAQLP